MSNKLGHHKLAFALAAVVAAACLAVPAGEAAACGPYEVTDEMRVGWVLDRHMQAVRTGDSEAFARVWDTEHGQSTAVGAAGARTTEPILAAFRRWAAEPDDAMTYEVDRVSVIAGRLAIAQVRMTWHGQPRLEHLTLVARDGRWTLVSKVHAPESPGAPELASPY